MFDKFYALRAPCYLFTILAERVRGRPGTEGGDGGKYLQVKNIQLVFDWWYKRSHNSANTEQRFIHDNNNSVHCGKQLLFIYYYYCVTCFIICYYNARRLIFLS